MTGSSSYVKLLDMKTLLTRQGISFTVDDDVAEHIKNARLDARKAARCARYYIYLNDVHIARWLLEITDPLLEADHIDCNPLNNVRSNLRVVTKAQNQHNKGKRRDNTTGVKNVSYDAKSGLYEVRVKLHGRQLFGGRFQLLADAAKAAEALRAKLHGEYARG